MKREKRKEKREKRKEKREKRKEKREKREKKKEKREKRKVKRERIKRKFNLIIDLFLDPFCSSELWHKICVRWVLFFGYCDYLSELVRCTFCSSSPLIQMARNKVLLHYSPSLLPSSAFLPFLSSSSLFLFSLFFSLFF